MKNKKLNLFVTIILIFTMFTGCGQVDEEKVNVQTDNSNIRNSLTIAEPNEWIGMDLFQTAYYTNMQTVVAEPLLMLDEDGQIVPCLASNYEISDDGKTIILTIPTDLKYANGEVLKPEDIKASIEHGLEVSPMNSDYAAIESIDVDGDKVIINLYDFSSSVLFYLTWQYITVIDKDQIDSISEDELLWKAMPYGMYKLDEFVSGSHATVSANPYYKTNYPGATNKEASKVDKLTLKFMSDDFSIVQGLKSGELDAAFQLSFENLAEFENDDTFVIEKNDPTFSVYALFNNDNEFLSDPKVCEAILALIDREQMSEINDMYKPSYSHILYNMMGYNQDIADYFKETYCNNKEKAINLLNEAGYKDTDSDGYLDKDGKPLEFTMIYYYAKSGKVAEIMQIQLKEAGIKMNVEKLEFALWNEATTSDKYDAALGLYGSDFGGGANMTYRLRDANILDKEHTDKFYEYIESADKTVNDVKRSELLAEAQRIYVDSKRIIPICQIRMATVYRKDIKGLNILSSQGGIFMFNDVDLK